jgi:hypothetical protein
MSTKTYVAIPLLYIAEDEDSYLFPADMTEAQLAFNKPEQHSQTATPSSNKFFT